MKAYSKEFRGQVLTVCDKGRSTREVATRFDVSESWVRWIKQECRELNKMGPWLKRRRTRLWAELADRMRELIQQKPDLTLADIKAELQTDLSVQTPCTDLPPLTGLDGQALTAMVINYRQHPNRCPPTWLSTADS